MVDAPSDMPRRKFVQNALSAVAVGTTNDDELGQAEKRIQAKIDHLKTAVAKGDGKFIMGVLAAEMGIVENGITSKTENYQLKQDIIDHYPGGNAPGIRPNMPKATVLNAIEVIEANLEVEGKRLDEDNHRDPRLGGAPHLETSPPGLIQQIPNVPIWPSTGKGRTGKGRS